MNTFNDAMAMFSEYVNEVGKEVKIDPAEVIKNYASLSKADDITEEARSTYFGKLRDLGIASTGAADFCETLKPAEDEYMNENHGHVEEARKKNGEWKYRSYTDANGKKVEGLPSGYYVAKSVIIRALEEGIVLDGKGKTELEQALKAKKEESAEEATPYEQAVKRATSLFKAWEKLSQTERENLVAVFPDMLKA